MARWCIVLGLLWATVTYGQSLGQLSGTVSDDSGSPIVGANVVLEGAALTEGKTGVSSDEGGRFVLTDIPAGTYVLRITHIGFSELVLADVSVDGENELELVMSDEVIFIDQSVVSASRRQEKISMRPHRFRL